MSSETAIHLAWTMVHDVFEFDTSKFFATVYSGDPKFPAIPADEESERVWRMFPVKMLSYFTTLLVFRLN